jgi:hypothetical protein
MQDRRAFSWQLIDLSMIYTTAGVLTVFLVL